MKSPRPKLLKKVASDLCSAYSENCHETMINDQQFSNDLNWRVEFDELSRLPFIMRFFCYTLIC